MTGEHVFIREESTAGTFLVPNSDAIPGVESFEYDTAFTFNDRREIGKTEGVTLHMQGTTKPTATLVMKVGPENLDDLAIILQALNTTITTSTPGGATNARDHSFIWNENGALNSLSIQVQRTKPTGTTSTHNIRGATPTSAEFSISTDGFLIATFSFVCMEVTKVAVDFLNGDTSSAAASVTYPSVIRLFNFADLTLKTATAKSWNGTTKLYTLTTPTTQSEVPTASVSVDSGKSHVMVLGQRYAADITRGELAITGSISVKNNTASNIDTWRDKVINHTTEIIHFLFAGDTDGVESGFEYEFEIIVPDISWTAATAPGLSMSHGDREFSPTFAAYLDSTNSQMIQFRIRNATTSY